MTGAGGGLGEGICRSLAAAGAAVACVDRDRETAEAIGAQVRASGGEALVVEADVSCSTSVEAMTERVAAELGGIDILVSVAGHQQAVKDISDLTTEQFDHTFKTNVHGLFWLCKSALAHMEAGGSIITTSSVQAYDPSPQLLDYAATKAAINTFSKALAQQVAERGIRVNVDAPGPVWTPLQVSGGQPTEKLPTFGEQAPLGRAGQPAELAAAYVYLASAESSYTTGSTLSVTGGAPTP